VGTEFYLLGSKRQQKESGYCLSLVSRLKVFAALPYFGHGSRINLCGKNVFFFFRSSSSVIYCKTRIAYVKQLRLFDTLKLVFSSNSASTLSLSVLSNYLRRLLCSSVRPFKDGFKFTCLQAQQIIKLRKTFPFFFGYSLFLRYCSSDLRSITPGASTVSFPYSVFERKFCALFYRDYSNRTLHRCWLNSGKSQCVTAWSGNT
jgi:hypothetical protein